MADDQLQSRAQSQTCVAVPMADGLAGMVAPIAAAAASMLQFGDEQNMLPVVLGIGGYAAAAIPSQFPVSGLQVISESPESTLLDPHTSPSPPISGQKLPLELPASNLRPQSSHSFEHVPHMQSSTVSQQQQIYYPPPLAAHQDVVTDRQLFFHTLTKFHAFFQTQLVIPKLKGEEVDLHLLYCQVTANGGLEQVIKLKKWSDIINLFGLSTQVSSPSYFFRKHYSDLLYHYEQVYFFRNEGQLVPPPVPLPSPSSHSHNQRSFSVAENFEPERKRRRKNFDQVEIVEDAAKLVGRPVTGAIDGKFDHGYLVTVHVGSEKLRGILYHLPIAHSTQQFRAALPEPKNKIGVRLRSPKSRVGPPHKRRGRISKRDPNAPRVNRSSYNYFFAEQRSRLKHLGSENAEITRIIGEMWQGLSAQERMPYLQQGQTDKERYRKQKEEYHERIKMQLQQRHEEGFLKGFPELVHDTGHAAEEFEEAEQESGDLNDTGHDYHVSLDSDVDGGATNISQDNNLQTQIYSLYVSGDHLSYGQEHLIA